MARFKKGQTVYMGRGDKMQTLVVAKVHKNPLLPIHQYTFEGKQFACGEQSIRATINGRDLTLKECMVDDNEMEVRVNTMANAMRGIIGEREAMLNMKLSIFDSTRVDFRPDINMCHWFKEYANGRLILHIDSGQGHFVRMLRQFSKARATGIEPNINKSKMLEIRATHRGLGEDDVNEILEGDLEDYINIINGLGNKALLVFTRPKDTKNLNLAINTFYGKCEILLVDVKLDGDISPFVKLKHEGVSEDNEVVYSFKK